MIARNIVVTGASDGIGAAAAVELARRGHHVTVVGRSPQKAAAVAGQTGGEYFAADFAALDAVRDVASQVLAHCGRIDVLANNAGAMLGRKRQVSEDGHELTFQVNYLAPFLLTRLLTGRLLESGGTVINTSSAAHRVGRARAVSRSPLRHLVLTPDNGARTLVQLAGGVPGQDYVTGEYYQRGKVAAINRAARNRALAQDLWNRSVALLEG